MYEKCKQICIGRNRHADRIGYTLNQEIVKTTLVYVIFN